MMMLIIEANIYVFLFFFIGEIDLSLMIVKSKSLHVIQLIKRIHHTHIELLWIITNFQHLHISN